MVRIALVVSLFLIAVSGVSAQTTRISPGEVYTLSKISNKFWKAQGSEEFVPCGAYFIQFKHVEDNNPMLIFSGIMPMLTAEFAKERGGQVYAQLRVLKFLSELEIVPDDTVEVPVISRSFHPSRNTMLRISASELKASPCLAVLRPT